MTSRFDWDQFTNRALFRDVRALQLNTDRLPTMYNPDRTELYLSTLDQAVRVDDAERIKYLIHDIAQEYREGLKDSRRSFRRLAHLEADYHGLASLARDLGETVDELI
ncbi:hypothetical protein NLO98_16850 [Pseudomonas syringae]|nr:hypothetical protein [Pseudomonas syringae]